MHFEDIPGIRAPFHSDPDKEARRSAADRSMAHLLALEKRHGSWFVGDDGRARFQNGEDLAYRMVRDGYAVPAMDRKDLTKAQQASQRAGRGLWAAAINPAGVMVAQGARTLLNASDELTR